MRPCTFLILEFCLRKTFKHAIYKNLFLIYYFFQINLTNIMGMYDKQFGRNSASLFIFEFAFRQTSHYCMQFVNKLREKTFFAN